MWWSTLLLSHCLLVGGGPLGTLQKEMSLYGGVGCGSSAALVSLQHASLPAAFVTADANLLLSDFGRGGRASSLAGRVVGSNYSADSVYIVIYACASARWAGVGVQ